MTGAFQEFMTAEKRASPHLVDYDLLLNYSQRPALLQDLVPHDHPGIKTLLDCELQGTHAGTVYQRKTPPPATEILI